MSKINKNFLLVLLFFDLCLGIAVASDLDQVVSGAETEDILGNSKITEPSPYVIQSTKESELDQQKLDATLPEDFLFNDKLKEVSIKTDPKNKFEDIGQSLPGTITPNENYIEIDKNSMAAEFGKHSSGGMNIAFIKNDYNYESQNDIINKTISEGPKHVKAGAVYVRSDQYFFHTDYLNTFWSLGGGLGFNSGKGLFVTGERSETTFRLWEVPLDLGVGLEIPIFHWFKISGVAGPSGTVLFQNRSDFLSGEKGKNKRQVSYGQFANAQFKINLSRLNSDTAYELFTESKITNLFINLEARYQSYRNFQDEIKITGTSYGIGFTFEYL